MLHTYNGRHDVVAGYGYDGAVYCVDCVPLQATHDEPFPILGGSESDSPQSCDICHVVLTDECPACERCGTLGRCHSEACNTGGTARRLLLAGWCLDCWRQEKAGERVRKAEFLAERAAVQARMYGDWEPGEAYYASPV